MKKKLAPKSKEESLLLSNKKQSNLPKEKAVDEYNKKLLQSATDSFLEEEQEEEHDLSSRLSPPTENGNKGKSVLNSGPVTSGGNSVPVPSWFSVKSK